MGCTPDLLPKLQSKYGSSLLQWVQAEFGANLIKQQFSGVRSNVENIFNKGGYDPSKMSLFDQVVGKINDQEVREVNTMVKDKPAIRQLDNLTP